MSYEAYKLIHIFGMYLLFFSLGGVTLYSINGGKKSDNKFKTFVAIFHGVGLVLLLFAGFGLMKFRDISHSALPVWIIAKILIWLAFGGLLTLAYKNQKAAKILWFVFPLLGLLAAYLAFYQPS
ncbi:DUF2878 family protein [Leptospira yanagawae]|uniref:DUF2878 family protein n=2 Tax=Leptospira yanagawae TaxID=293069 RepID=A0ABY2LXE5_9LEPT|nr:DUF2878 family protein [Leptospira yanagawae]